MYLECNNGLVIFLCDSHSNNKEDWTPRDLIIQVLFLIETSAILTATVLMKRTVKFEPNFLIVFTTHCLRW